MQKNQGQLLLLDGYFSEICYIQKVSKKVQKVSILCILGNLFSLFKYKKFRTKNTRIKKVFFLKK